MANTYTLIEAKTLTTTTASITFSSIPATYTDLLVKFSSRCNATAVQNMAISLNGSTANFTFKNLYGGGSLSNNYGSGNGSTNLIGIAEGNDYTASTFDNGEIYIPNYATANYKSISADSVTETNAAEAYIEPFASLWSNTAAITSVGLATTSGSFLQYSSFYLYGIKSS